MQLPGEGELQNHIRKNLAAEFQVVPPAWHCIRFERFLPVVFVKAE